MQDIINNKVKKAMLQKKVIKTSPEVIAPEVPASFK